MDENEMIRVENVYKSFLQPTGEMVQVLNGISLDIHREEFFSIIGPSGCGKSTILNIITGLLEPTRGRVSINREAFRNPKSGIGYMMQKDLLLPWRTILENATLGLEVMGIAPAEREAIAMAYMDRYGLSSFRDAYPDMLSGGMRQRAALIRTLATNPDIIMLDEPFSALDYQTRLLLEDEILSILRREKKTCILITHDIEEAVALSDRVAVMSKRPTTVKEIYDIGLSAKYQSAMKSRLDNSFKGYFNEIWNRLDIQVEGGQSA